jgi:hypothetical protein
MQVVACRPYSDPSYAVALAAADGVHTPAAVQQAVLSALASSGSSLTLQQLQQLQEVLQSCCGGALPRTADQLHKLQVNTADDGPMKQQQQQQQQQQVSMTSVAAGACRCPCCIRAPQTLAAALCCCRLMAKLRMHAAQTVSFLTDILLAVAPAVLQHWQLCQIFLQELQSAATAAGKGDLQESSCYLHCAVKAVQQHGAACLQSHM